MDIVANVSVTNITMLNAQNGARIKVFGGNPDPSAYYLVFATCETLRARDTFRQYRWWWNGICEEYHVYGLLR